MQVNPEPNGPLLQKISAPKQPIWMTYCLWQTNLIRKQHDEKRRAIMNRPVVSNPTEQGDYQFPQKQACNPIQSALMQELCNQIQPIKNIKLDDIKIIWNTLGLSNLNKF